MKDSKTLQEEQGWDIIIGNPPYISKKKKEYPQYRWNTDLYLIFFEMGLKITKPNGHLTFITPRFWLTNENCENMRCFFLDEINLISLTEANPFAQTTENVITFLQNCESKQTTFSHYKENNKAFNLINEINKSIFKNNARNEIVFSLNEDLLKIFNRISAKTIPLKEITISKRGAEYGKKFIKTFTEGRKILVGYDVSAYSIQWDNLFVDEKLKDIQRLSAFFESEKIIYLRRVDKRLSASISSEKFAFTKNIYGINVVDSRYSHKFILALLNSKLLNFYYLKKFGTKKEQYFPEIQTYLYEQLPIPKITDSNQHLAEKMTCLVEEILESKAKDSKADTTHLQSQIDSFVYALYELDSKEIAIIESLKESK